MPESEPAPVPVSEPVPVAAALSPRQTRVIKLSTAIVALVIVALILAVGELFILRAESRAQVRRLACYAVQYSPDTDQTAKEIRAAYGCPPAKAIPRRAARPATPPDTAAKGGQGSASAAPDAGPVPAAQQGATDSPSASGQSLVPSPPTPLAPLQPTPSVSSSAGLLGGLLCEPAALPICLKVGSPAGR